MKKHVLVLSLFLCMGAGACAQQVAASPAIIAPADSVEAIERLFRSRRTGSTILGIPSGYFLGYGAVATAQGVDQAPLTLGIGVVLSAVTIAKSVRFSKQREEEIITNYQQGKPIPKNIKRRLRRKHFKV